ncbi:MAG: hypothetical protein LBG21_05595 [Campylobacteraceae bacterium]|jgi:hypothetical protein|nr:hypothetical protein [Campylobacteraceae bacterium]
MKNIFLNVLLFMLFGILLSGCLGGGSGSDPTPIPTPTPSTTITLGAGCSGDYCGSSGNNYTGNGIGIWHAKNSVASSAKLNVELSNVANREITIVFTNEGDANVVLPKINVDTSLNSIISDSVTEDDKKIVYSEKRLSNEELIRLYQQSLLSNEQPLKSIYAAVYNVNDEKEWIIEPYEKVEKRQATLIKQVSSDGRIINFWVENDEYKAGKITSTILSNVVNKFLYAYPKVVELAGEPWGDHKYPNEAIPSNQQLNIVFANFDKNNKPYGMAGYFFNLNNLIAPEYSARSNQALVVFVDTETFYLDGAAGFNAGLSSTLHELTHAINFYNRYIDITDPFDMFLEEFSAILTEDLFSSLIHDNSIYNQGISRYYLWLKNSSNFNIDFANWVYGDVNSYNTAGSFGAYLLRQHGVNFYKKLFQTHGNPSATTLLKNSLNILDKTIKNFDSKGLEGALQHWGAGISLLPPNQSPKGYGYPSLKQDGFELPYIDSESYRSTRKLPTSSPATLNAHAHFPFLRKTSQNIFKESFTVPRNVSVTVIVK